MLFRAFTKILITQCYVNFRTTIETVTKSLVIILFTLLDYFGRVILFLLFTGDKYFRLCLTESNLIL